MAKRSARWSMGLPDACSGAMYANLPLIAPDLVIDALSTALAMPKSTSFTEPSKPMRMFCGEMSRWTTFSGRPESSERVCA